MAARMRVCERLRRVRFYGAERTRYARANTLLTDFAYHWPPRGHACCRGSLNGLALLLRDHGDFAGARNAVRREFLI